MDGENNGKPGNPINKGIQMDDLGGPPLFLETPLFWGGRISSSPKKMAGHHITVKNRDDFPMYPSGHFFGRVSTNFLGCGG